MKTRVAIIEDNARFREELAALIASAKDLELAASAGSAEEALVKIPALAPNVVVMDINLPGASGIECTAKLRELLPDAQILMLTVYEDTDSIFRALQAGATGYLLKRAHPRDILNAIREVREGGAPMSSHIARKVVESFSRPAAVAPADPEMESLTPREREILDLLAEGFLYKEIADKLSVSYSTVQTHVERIYRKLQVHSRSQAVARAHRK
jgi:DNA-binding NarL/FixJ family response regulator